MVSSLKSAVSKARSMHDLSLPPNLSTKSHHHHHQLSQPSPLSCPEVTGVSPREGRTNSRTRLTIRGSHLGLSASDVLSLTVAGVDCTPTLDYDSSTRLSCIVGPTTAGPAVGDVIVETKSGGLGISMVQFRFVEPTGADDEQFTAVPYDAGESRLTSGESRPTTTGSPLMRLSSAPAAAGNINMLPAFICIYILYHLYI